VTERRRSLRFETALSGLCEIVSEKWKSASRIKNISKGGALVLLPKSLAEGSELNISLDVPGDNIPVFASCQVAWQKELKKSPGDDSLYETGLRFVKMGSPDKGRLLEYIYTQWLRLLDDVK